MNRKKQTFVNFSVRMCAREASIRINAMRHNIDHAFFSFSFFSGLFLNLCSKPHTENKQIEANKKKKKLPLCKSIPTDNVQQN